MFIEIQRRSSHKNLEDNVNINVNCIVFIQSRDLGGSLIHLTGADSIVARETREEVMSLIAEATKHGTRA